MITSFDLEKFGKSAASEFVSGGVPMNDSILKLANDHNLNLQQIHRVVESANVDTYLNLIKTSEDKYVDFPLADAPSVYKQLTADSDAPQNEVSNDYEAPPAKTASVDIFSVTEEELEKVAEVKTSYADIRKEAARVEGICRYIVDESDKIRADFANNYEKIWKITKHAVLNEENINNVFEVIKVASPSYANYILEDFTEYMGETMPHIDISKEASYKGVINPKSELYKLGENLEYLGDRFNKVANAFVSFTDRYEALRKEASTLGGLKKMLLGAGQAAAGVAGGIAKAITAHKKLILAGLGGAAVYQIGKSKGRQEQGEILQKKMLPSKYRNISY